MKLLKLLIVFFFLCSCKKENQEVKQADNRIIVKTINNGYFEAILYKKSTISDITSYVSVIKNKKESVVFHGDYDSVIDIYFKGKDTLYLKCYKPSSTIIYDFKEESDGLSILKDTLVTKEEFIKKSHQ